MGGDGPVVALIPARAGSRGVPGKNVADLAGFPLIAYSIAAGLWAERIDRVIVTTDSNEIAELGRRLGADAPFLRPAELARDDSLDIDYVRHALGWLEEQEAVFPELVVQLRPTTPLRDPRLIDSAVEAVRARAEATGLRSVHQLQEPPQKMLGVEGSWLVGLFPDETREEYFNLPRQAFPPAYCPNGYVDVIRPGTLAAGSLYGNRVLGFETPEAVEIDGPAELDYARFLLDRDGHPLLSVMKEHSHHG